MKRLVGIIILVTLLLFLLVRLLSQPFTTTSLGILIGFLFFPVVTFLGYKMTKNRKWFRYPIIGLLAVILPISIVLTVILFILNDWNTLYLLMVDLIALVSGIGVVGTALATSVDE